MKINWCQAFDGMVIGGLAATVLSPWTWNWWAFILAWALVSCVVNELTKQRSR